MPSDRLLGWSSALGTTPGDDLDLSIVAAVNDEGILARNLLRSPAVQERQVRLYTYCNQPSASRAYNLGLEETDSELVAFVHQDVYLPASWMAFLHAAISTLDRTDPEWAVLGVFGITADSTPVGLVWSSGLGREIGTPLPSPVPVVGVDELAFVVRRSSGCAFDPGLPNFHLYGADIVQAARRQGKGAYVANLPVIHNSRPVRVLDASFVESYRYMQKKWRNVLPIPSLVVPLTTSSFPLLRARVRAYWKQGERMRRAAPSTGDPRNIARHLGYE